MSQGWTPPSFSYRTFAAFFEDLAGRGALPARLDLSAVAGYPPSVGPQLLDLLERMGLLDADGTVAPGPMRAVVSGRTKRRDFLRAWAREAYAEQLRLVEAGAPEEELHASFAAFGYRSHKVPRAVRFFHELRADLGPLTRVRP
ncbi:hypothetical protein [Actinocorallia sp. A-T 12471]|uniref:hypothetical protein n=1 Tax=Actinocorallia sp. A-T 12471 TaxID=3089813 RepID=UPI0029D05C44|nr:hypothetical protein [Actinocorallia sp. A-T 12471]MDX6744051.1 hypothetical protein [Actinocorallia sp. A-T 12471]